jgi:hypothetical protein
MVRKADVIAAKQEGAAKARDGKLDDLIAEFYDYILRLDDKAGGNPKALEEIISRMKAAADGSAQEVLNSVLAGLDESTRDLVMRVVTGNLTADRVATLEAGEHHSPQHDPNVIDVHPLTPSQELRDTVMAARVAAEKADQLTAEANTAADQVSKKLNDFTISAKFVANGGKVEGWAAQLEDVKSFQTKADVKATEATKAVKDAAVKAVAVEKILWDLSNGIAQQLPQRAPVPLQGRRPVNAV